MSTIKTKPRAPRCLPGKEAAALVVEHQSRLPKQIAGMLAEEDEVLVYSGATRVAGDLLVGPANVLVVGDLVVEGHIVDGVKADHSLLVVLGNVEARNIVTLSEIAITGNVKAEVIYGNSLGDDRFSVAGDVSATAIIGNGHWFHVVGNISAGAKIAADTTASIPDPDYSGADVARILVASVMENGSIDLGSMVKALKAGTNVLREGIKTARQIALEKVDAARASGNADTIALAGTDLCEFPQRLLAMTGLRSLDLSSNKIETLPEGIGKLASLEELNLDGNALTELPEAIGDLTKLASLNLHLNCVTTLPDSFEKLQALRDLNLSMNTSLKTNRVKGATPMRVVPEVICTLANLRVLDLATNEIERLPPDFANLRELEDLSLGDNHLQTFPKALLQLRKLRSLRIGKQKGAPPPLLNGLEEMTWLENLTIDRLELKKLPAGLAKLTRLKTLGLAFNEMTTLPEAFYDLTELRELNLRYVSLDAKTLEKLATRLPLCKLLV